MRKFKLYKDLDSKKTFKEDKEYKDSFEQIDTIDELTELLSTESLDIMKAIECNANTFDDSEMVFTCDEKIKLGDIIRNSSSDIDNLIERIDLYDAINKIFNKMEYRDQVIIKYLYGLGYDRKNQYELAEKFKISQARISFINMKFKIQLAKELSIDLSFVTKNKQKRIGE